MLLHLLLALHWLYYGILVRRCAPSFLQAFSRADRRPLHDRLVTA
jgi:hypothetical protein